MMFKKTALSLFLLFVVGFAHAQTADQVYDQYIDFNMARSDKNYPKSFLIGESLLPQANKLPPKAKTILFYSMAKLYEDSGNTDKAITYYEKVTAAAPDYYVPHLALGYIYFNKFGDFSRKLQTVKIDAKLMADYKAIALKALPHLEKAEACEHNEETLDMIKTLYTAIKDTAGLNSLKSRLAALSKNCVTLLSE
jgi:tetratricopeptide (TPR) repeat protein